MKHFEISGANVDKANVSFTYFNIYNVQEYPPNKTHMSYVCTVPLADSLLTTIVEKKQK